MSKYIEADKVDYRHDITQDKSEEFVKGMIFMAERYNLAPSIDITLCKDYKHYVREYVEEFTPYGFSNFLYEAFCDKHFDKELGEYISVHDDDFCSFAEREE